MGGLVDPVLGNLSYLSLCDLCTAHGRTVHGSDCATVKMLRRV